MSSWTVIISDLRDVGVSVSSKTIRRRLADVRLKARLCPYPHSKVIESVDIALRPLSYYPGQETVLI
ncbi:hypothetical protein TNCV_2783841 [Trichonephila clavipes]|nr:hypothetical protein TNCV_2783841 [Trichonephila clavipes]